MTPYSLQVVKKGRRGGGGEAELGGEGMDQDAQESDEEGEDLKADAMIKVRAIECVQTQSHVSVFIFVFISCVSCASAAEKGQSHQRGKKGERRFWEGQRQGQGQGQEMTLEENKLSFSASDCPCKTIFSLHLLRTFDDHKVVKLSWN